MQALTAQRQLGGHWPPDQRRQILGRMNSATVRPFTTASWASRWSSAQKHRDPDVRPAPGCRPCALSLIANQARTEQRRGLKVLQPSGIGTQERTSTAISSAQPPSRPSPGPRRPRRRPRRPLHGPVRPGGPGFGRSVQQVQISPAHTPQARTCANRSWGPLGARRQTKVSRPWSKTVARTSGHVGRLGRLDGDGPAPGFGDLRRGDGQDAIDQGGGDLVAVDGARQGDRPGKAP